MTDKEAYVDALAAAVMERVEARQEAERLEHESTLSARRSHRILLGLACAALLGLAANAAVLLRDQPVFTPAEEAAGVRLEIYLTAQAIETWRNSTGTLPPDLAVLGYDDTDLTYTREGDNAYVLRASLADPELVYQSGQDLAPYAAAYRLFNR